MRKRFLKELFLCLLLCISFLISDRAKAALQGTPEEPLHIVAIDSCFFPSTVDFLEGKHVIIELITSAHPALKKLFTPTICIQHYERAVGALGKVVGFHSRFLGKEMEDELLFKNTLNHLVEKRGKIDVVLSNASDLATYMSQKARNHLGLPEAWDMDCPECFYDKWVMKTQLMKKDPGIKTAPFIALDAPKESIEHFVSTTAFPLILKKRRSAGSVGIKVLSTESEFRETYNSIKDKDNYLVEKFIKGRVLRIQGEKVKDEVIFTIPSMNRTTPLEHYQGGKSRITSTIDEDEIPMAHIRDFTERVLVALQMHTGTYHLEAIFSDDDKDLYFMEIAARPGAGNMDQVYRDLHHYDPQRSFYFRQFPPLFWNKSKVDRAELFMNPTSRSSTGDVYAVMTYPFQDANRFTFQNIQTNLHPTYQNKLAEGLTTFKGCDYDDHISIADYSALSHEGVQISRYAFQAALKAVSCRFEGPRAALESDLRTWQERAYFQATPIKSWKNALVPRKILMAGGL